MENLKYRPCNRLEGKTFHTSCSTPQLIFGDPPDFDQPPSLSIRKCLVPKAGEIFGTYSCCFQCALCFVNPLDIEDEVSQATHTTVSTTSGTTSGTFECDHSNNLTTLLNRPNFGRCAIFLPDILMIMNTFLRAHIIALSLNSFAHCV